MYFGFDTETSGLDPRDGAQILSLAYILLTDDLHEVARKQYFVMPDENAVLSPQALAINGYTPELWKSRNAIKQDDLFEALRADWKYYELFGAWPLGQNVGFDLDFLKEGGRSRPSFAAAQKRALSYHKVDTISLAVPLDAAFGIRGEKYGLIPLCERWGVPLTNAHDSMADIEATVSLYRALVGVLRTATRPQRPEAPVSPAAAALAASKEAIKASVAERRSKPPT